MAAALGTTAAGAASRWRWTENGDGLPRAGQWRQGFDLADFDGDGRLDLVHGPPRRAGGPPRIFLGREGGFALWPDAVFPDLPFDYGDVAAADLDGDGATDLAVAIHQNGVVVLSGDGAGSFSLQASFLQTAVGVEPFFSRALLAHDLDGDGRPDLAALGEGPMLKDERSSYGVRLLLNRLPDDWLPRELRPATRNLFGDDLVAADFDADGKVDLATASHVQGQRRVVFWGRGGGELEDGEIEALRPRSFVDAVAAADFDGDGADDLVVAYSQPPEERVGIDILFATRDRAWSGSELSWPHASGAPSAIAAGDPDGDGDQDVVALTDSGAVVSFVNQSGKLRRGPVIGPRRAGNGCRGYHLELADLDGDGREELLAAFAGESCPGGGSLRAWGLPAPRRRPSS